MIRGLHAVFTAVWYSGTIPPHWKRGLVVPIWKDKGDRQDCKNHGGKNAAQCTRQGARPSATDANLESLAEVSET